MSLRVRSAGIWRDSIPYVKAAGTWKIADYVWNKQSGQWYTSFIKGGLVDKSWDSLDQTGQFGINANGSISSMTIQSDGKILIGGTFGSWNGTAVGYIVRLNSNGTLDTDFITNNGSGTNGNVISIIVQSDGKILLCGDFTTWNGTTVGRIVRLNSDGTIDTAFSTNIGTGAEGYTPQIYSMAIQSDGKILLGGDFTDWNGALVYRIVRLNSSGARDTAFTTNTGVGSTSYPIYSIAVQSDGKILLGGDFTDWNSTAVNRIVRLNSNGTRDTSFTTNIGTGGNNYIISIAVQSDGKILIGGYFTSWNGTVVGNIVRLNSDGTTDLTFTTNNGSGANTNISLISIQSDGKILLGGDFTTWNGTTVGRIVRLNSDGTIDTAFTANNGSGGGSSISSIAVQSDAKILIGGNLYTWNGTAVGNIVRLNSTGANSDTLSSFADYSVYSIAIQSDGKILLGGDFTTWNGTAVGYIVRLNSNGTRDTTFTTNNGTGANSSIRSMTIQSDGKILLGGDFTTWNGTTVGRIVRLNSDGTRDTSFTTSTGTGANNTIRSIAVQSDGKILLGGDFTTWNGTTVGRIVRLGSTGTRDTSFTTSVGTGANNIIMSVAVQSDGKILAGGYFTSWSSTTVGRIVRLNSDGTRDTSFTTSTGTGANNTIMSVAIQSDGKILVGGYFTTWNGTTVNRIVRLGSTGARDTSFTTSTGTGANSSIMSVAVQSDGKILLGGYFTTWNGTTVGSIVRLNSTGILDAAFTVNTGIGANSSVNSIAIQSDGKVLLGGGFTLFKTNTEFRRCFVRIGGEIA
jgi:uncharacterized delta-60 repeat protein